MGLNTMCEKFIRTSSLKCAYRYIYVLSTLSSYDQEGAKGTVLKTAKLYAAY